MKEKIKKLLKDRKKLIGVIGVALLIIVTAIICAFIMSKKQDKNVLKLKQDQFIVEYGDSISLDPRVYLKEDINNDIISNTEVEILGDKKYEAGKEYFAVGDYQIQLTYEDEKIQTQVTVKDTTIPILNIPATIEIPKNTDLSKYDFKSLITASDLSQLTDLKFDTSKVDMTKKGEYQATVSVEDSSKNKAEKTFTIKVVAELKENEKEDNNSSITANGVSTSKPTSNNNHQVNLQEGPVQLINHQVMGETQVHLIINQVLIQITHQVKKLPANHQIVMKKKKNHIHIFLHQILENGLIHKQNVLHIMREK
mgnify:CR=1 FL=1